MSQKNMRDMPDEYWKEKLTSEQYKVAREKGTESAFTGKYIDNHADGSYTCMACGHSLFDSATKFESGSGWPSFTNPVNLENVELHEDKSFGMTRTEVVCANCGAHLGHVFNDGPPESGGQRYCINSISLDFLPKDTTKDREGLK